MIRCHKCGYSNQDNAQYCIKCRTNLEHDGSGSDAPENPGAADLSQNSRKTIVIAGNDVVPWDQDKTPPVRPNRIMGGIQPGTGSATPPPAVGGGAKTVRRVVPNPDACCLVAISVEDARELRKIDLHGKNVSLNRAILDPGNNSISRSGHANIYQKDGNWYLENTSALKTTFIQVDHPVKLSDGDIILMGDSLFKFNLGNSESKPGSEL